MMQKTPHLPASAVYFFTFLVVGGAVQSYAQAHFEPHVVQVAVIGHILIGSLMGVYAFLDRYFTGKARAWFVTGAVGLSLTPYFNLVALVLSDGKFHARGQIPLVGSAPAVDPHWLNVPCAAVNLFAVVCMVIVWGYLVRGWLEGLGGISRIDNH